MVKSDGYRWQMHVVVTVVGYQGAGNDKYDDL